VHFCLSLHRSPFDSVGVSDFISRCLPIDSTQVRPKDFLGKIMESLRQNGRI